MSAPDALTIVLLVAFAACQGLYFLTFVLELYLFTRPVNWVRVSEARNIPEREYPEIVLFYPVLRELESTMRTTMVALSRMKYPSGRARVIALANSSDVPTVEALRRLQGTFPFLELEVVPPTTDPSWDVVWRAWDENPKAYWWHQGDHARQRDLPPKKTRQLIYGFYRNFGDPERARGVLIDYIDADSAPPPDHFLAAVAGMRHYDVLQAQNVAGNLNASLAASWHALDHMAWDGGKYAHLSANGRHPYWVLGKGLFFRASDLLELGGLHPWMAIEDPEVGMRFWKNGKRLGIIESPLIEEVPLTFRRGIVQRKRWVCGFFQSLGEPLDRLGFTRWEKAKAWMNFLPCLSLWINTVGLPTGAWGLWTFVTGADILPLPLVILCLVNVTAFTIAMSALYARTWLRTALVLGSRRARIAYMLRVNPLFVAIWWGVWLIPLAIGFWMYLHDRGRVWERTEKIDANRILIEEDFGGLAHQRAA